MTIRIISFGYGHGQLPTADLTYDLRVLLRNPHHDPALRDLTALDPVVYDHVMATPGAARLAFSAALCARGLVEETGAEVVMAYGCTGGRHRSVGLARRTYELLDEEFSLPVTIEHRDIDQPLLPSGVHNRERQAPPMDIAPRRHTLADRKRPGEVGPPPGRPFA